ncbi:hypothetical protein ACFUJU_03265 [Streptomyces sp. NPDC057235]|uniref:hypothetical protein n=1 Tax=Streptomyces sp. NPDC057235 TaxID=3346058 RepID=UPI003640EB95
MGRPLKDIPTVRWGEISDSKGSAVELPNLLSRVAWSDKENGQAALEEIADRVCELGFVVSEATHRTVPFLLELAGWESCQHRAEIIELLHSIFSSRQWSEAASGAAKKYRPNFYHKIQWEQDSRKAVLSGRAMIESLKYSSDTQVASAAQNLVREFEQSEADSSQ